MDPANKRNMAILVQFIGLLCIGVYMPYGMIVGLVLVVVGGRLYRDAKEKIKAAKVAARSDSAEGETEATEGEPDSALDRINFNLVGGVLVLAVLAYNFWGVFFPNPHIDIYNSYAAQVRPHLLASSRLETRFEQMTVDLADASVDTLIGEVSELMEAQRKITNELDLVQTDDKALQDMNRDLVLYSSRKVDAYDAMVIALSRDENDTSPEPDIVGLIADSNAAFDSFLTAQNDYFIEHDLVEESSGQ